MTDDEWVERPPSEVALISVWPLVQGDYVPLHEDSCDLFVGGRRCDCKRIMLAGPTGFA